MKISSSNSEFNNFIRRNQMEKEQIEQRKLHSNKNASKINFEGLSSAFNTNNKKVSGLESIMKQKEEQEQILDKLKENQMETINSLKERFDELGEEIGKLVKNNSDIFKKYKGIDGDLDKILGDNTSDVLNSMDSKDVDDKLGSIISSLESNGKKDLNAIEAFKSLNELYKELYEVRDKAKEYLEESQRQIEKMQDKITKINDDASKLYSMNLIDIYDNAKSSNKNIKNDVNKISVKTSDDKKERLDVFKDEKNNEEQTVDKQKAIKLEDIKNLRKEADEARKEIKEKSDEIEKMHYKDWPKDKDLQNILQGNIPKMRESMNFEQLQDKVRSTVELLDKDNSPMVDKLRDLYSGYKKLYELDDKIKQTEKDIKTLEENKEKSNKKSTRRVSGGGTYSKIQRSSVSNKDQYYRLKNIVDEMYK